jgi:hypothetical protein
MSKQYINDQKIMSLFEHPVLKKCISGLDAKFKPSDKFRYVPSYSGGR